ncbi:MAG: hypothetical protein R3E97_15155 [Candidatus Eisenbacteria bacterium]
MMPTIAGSVGANAQNRKTDVETVQSLLNQVPPSEGGPVVPLAIDGLCYGKTLAAIGRFQKDGCGFQWPDQRIEPNRRTWNELSRYADTFPTGLRMVRCYPESGHAHVPFAFGASVTLAVATPAAASSAVAPPVGTTLATPASLVAEAKLYTPLAIAWVTATRARLRAVLSNLSRFKSYSKAEIELARPFAVHFKIDIVTQIESLARSRLEKVDRIYSRVLLVLGNPPYVGNPKESSKALAPMGGYDYPNAKIIIGAGFVKPGTSASMKAAVLVHEGAHFADSRCGHVATERPDPSGGPMTDDIGKAMNPTKKNYAQMDFDLAIQNAYSFAQCAAHCALGFDSRSY